MEKYFPSGLFLPFLFLVVAAVAQDTPSSSPSSTSSLSAPAASPSSAQQPPITQLLARGLQAYRTGKFDAAVEEYMTVLQQDPKSGEAYAGLTRVYLKQEKVQTAFETASKGVSEVSDSPATHTALGEVYFRQGKIRPVRRIAVEQTEIRRRIEENRDGFAV